MKIVNHIIEGVKVEESPNHGGKFNTGNLDTIIIHYTAGGSASSAIKTLTNPKVKASAHVVVSKEGTITQLVPFDTIAWHAGKSSYKSKVGLNKYSIGIEIDNAGKLEKRGDHFVSWFGKKYDQDEVIEAIHRNQSLATYWHTYTQEQIECVSDICESLIEEYNISSILGHEEISPGRKIDPGPAFPLDKLRTKLLSSDRDLEEEDSLEDIVGTVSVTKLNIRESPDINSQKVALPLPKASKVEVLERKNGWLKVSTKVTGWVAEKYIDFKE